MSESNVARLQAFYALASQAYADGTISPDLDELAHPDLVVEEPESLPYGGTYRGPEGFRDLLAATARFWELSEVRPRAWIEHGDEVIVLNHMSGRVRATGTPVSMPVVAIWRFEDAKVRHGQILAYDTHAIVAAAGLA